MPRYVPLESEIVAGFRDGEPDANGQIPERTVSTGGSTPCRHCLDNVKQEEGLLVLAHRPFPNPQPYAEVGPIFLHADECPRHSVEAGMPAMFREWGQVMVRGYGADDRIVYGTGSIVRSGDLDTVCDALLDRKDVAYLHLRSAKTGCFQCRVERSR